MTRLTPAVYVSPMIGGTSSWAAAFPLFLAFAPIPAAALAQPAAVFEMPSNSNDLPRTGPRSLCRRSNVVRSIIATMSSTEAVKGAGLTVYDFEGSSTSSVDFSALSFACHGVVRVSNGQALPGTFSVYRNAAGDPVWKWMNDGPRTAHPSIPPAPSTPAARPGAVAAQPTPAVRSQTVSLDYSRAVFNKPGTTSCPLSILANKDNTDRVFAMFGDFGTYWHMRTAGWNLVARGSTSVSGCSLPRYRHRTESWSPSQKPLVGLAPLLPSRLG